MADERETLKLGISIEIDDKDIQKQSKSLLDIFKKLFDGKAFGDGANKKMLSLGKSMKDTYNQIKKTETELKQVHDSIAKDLELPEINDEQLDALRQKLPEAIEATQEQLHLVIEELDAMEADGVLATSEAFQDATARAEELTNALESMNATMQKIEMSDKLTAQMDTLTDKGRIQLKQFADDGVAKFTKVIQIVGKCFRGIQKSFKETVALGKKAFSTILNIGKKAFGALVGVVKTLATSMKSLGGRSKSVSASFTNLGKTIFGSVLSVHALTSALSKLKSLGTAGIENLAKESKNADLSLRTLKASMLQLKNAVAAMVAPLINVLAPVLQRISNLLTDAANAVGMFFAALTGQGSFTKARYLDASYVEEDTKATKDNTKEKKKNTKAKKDNNKEDENRQLSGLDILNNLSSQKNPEEMQDDLEDAADALDDLEDKVGGAGGKLMFETVKVADKFKELADWFKKMWENADFTELGTKLGQGLQKLLKSIPWDKIQKNAEKVGKSLATLINGFVEVDKLGYDIGKTFAEGLNTIFFALDGFVSNLHWKSVGHFIADTVNGWFENIKWDKIKHTFTTGFQGIADAINQFIEDFHWDNISTAITNVIDIITSSFSNILNIDFGALGFNLGDQLAKIINKTDWKEVGKVINKGINKVIDFVTNFIKGSGQADFGKAFSELFSGLDPMSIAKRLIGLLNDAVDHLLEWLKNTDMKALGAKLAARISELLREVDWDDLGEALGALIQGGIDFLVGMIKGDGENGNGIWKDLVSAIAAFFSGLGKNKEVMKGLEIGAKALIGVFASKLLLNIGGTVLSAVGPKIIESILTGAGVTSSGTAAAGGATAAAGSSILGALGSVLGVAGGVVIGAKLGEGIVRGIGEITGDDLLKEYKLGDGIKGIVDVYQTGAAQIYNSTKKIEKDMKRSFKNINMSNSESVDEAKKDINRFIEAYKDAGYSVSYATSEIENQLKDLGYNQQEINKLMLKDVGDFSKQYTDAYNYMSTAIETTLQREGRSITEFNDDYLRQKYEALLRDGVSTEEATKVIEGYAQAITDAGGRVSDLSNIIVQYGQSEEYVKVQAIGTEGAIRDMSAAMQNEAIAKAQATANEFNNLGNTMKETATTAGEAGTAVSDNYADNIVAEMKFRNGDITAAGAGAVEGVKKGGESKEGETKSFFSKFVTGIVDLIKEKLNPEEMKAFGRKFIEGLFNGIKPMVEKVTTFIKTFVDKVKNLVKNLVSTISNTVSSISTKLSNASNKLSSFVNSAASRFGSGSWIGNKIRGYASGQVIPPNMQQHIAVLGDNNRETEVVSPLSTMKQAMIEALAESNFGGGSDRPIVVEIDGKQVFSVTRDYASDYKKRTGSYAFG